MSSRQALVLVLALLLDRRQDSPDLHQFVREPGQHSYSILSLFDNSFKRCKSRGQEEEEEEEWAWVRVS